MELREIAYDLMEKVEFYGVTGEFQYKYGDFEKVKRELGEGVDKREADYCSIIKVCGEILESTI